MLTERDILEVWQTGKSNDQFYRLNSEEVVGFEYRGLQVGHPSNYAKVVMAARPSSDFSLDSTAEYPPSVCPSEAGRILLAIGRAAVDELFGSGWYPYRGCKLIVQEIGWDDVMSSEWAFYRATRGALSKLRLESQWTLST